MQDDPTFSRPQECSTLCILLVRSPGPICPSTLPEGPLTARNKIQLFQWAMVGGRSREASLHKVREWFNTHQYLSLQTRKTFSSDKE